jgi:hypothetical protein
MALAQASAPADWRFAHPNADMKVSVNFQALLKSDAVAKAMEQVKAQAKDNAAQIDLVMGMLRTIDRVSVSAVQKAPNDMDVLAEVSGSFDPQLIAGFFPSNGKSQVKVVAPHTILIGDGDSFTAAVARLNGPAPAEAVGGLPQSDIWIEAGVEFLAKQSGQAMPPMLQDLRGFAVGLTLADSPVVDVVLTASGEEGARKLLGTMKIMNAAAAGQPSVGDLTKNISLEQDGSRVKMHAVIPPEIVAMIQDQAKSAMAGGSVPTGLAPLLSTLGLGGGIAGSPASRPRAGTAAAPPAPAQNGGTIKIYGLDDGTKEIQAPK